MNNETKELKDFIRKENQKKWLEIFMILDEISQTEDIISFTYDKYYLTIKIGKNDYIRVHLTDTEIDNKKKKK